MDTVGLLYERRFQDWTHKAFLKYIKSSGSDILFFIALRGELKRELTYVTALNIYFLQVVSLHKTITLYGTCHTAIQIHNTIST